MSGEDRTLGFIGLGAMGRGMSSNVARKHPGRVLVFDMVPTAVEAVVGAVFMSGLVMVYRRSTARRAAASSDELVAQGRRSLQYVAQAIASVREVQLSGRRDHL